MKKLSKAFAFVCIASTGLVEVPAQVATPPSPAAPAHEETIELSPFEVNASSDVGYQATDTLGGTRIRTNLRDVGSAISVATKEFMSDIGATNAQTLLQYMTGTEVGGVQGNFMLGSNVGDAGLINDNAARGSPQSNNRVRGLDAADNTRDFFLTDIPFDTYNISRIDVQRGANSILFGNGSGAGIINGSTDSALIGKDSVTVSGRYGSYGSYRGSLNINRDIIKGELAIRLAMLHDQQYFQQEPAFNKDRRQYAALRWEPKFLARGEAHTTFRLSFENGDISANRPRLNTINDAISPWFITAPQDLVSPYATNAAGNTLLGTLLPMKSHAGYDPFVTAFDNAAQRTANPTRQDLSARSNSNFNANPNAEPWLGAFNVASAFGATQIGPGMDGTGFNAWTAVFDDPASPTMSRLLYNNLGTMFNAVNTNGVRDGHTVSQIRSPDVTGLLRLGDYAFRGVGNFKYTNMGIYRSKTILDPSTFDFYNKLIDGPTKAEGSKFTSFNATMDQTFWGDRLGFQVAYDRQEYADYRVASLNNPTLYIDIYRYLPVAVLNAGTGLFEPVVNPNFGRPYVISQSTGNQRSNTKRDTFRVTPYADLNFPDLMKSDSVLTKILGRHTINALYEEYRYERESSTWSRNQLDANSAAQIFGATTNAAVNGGQRNIATVHYLGSAINAAPTLAGADISAISALQQARDLTTSSGRVTNAWYFNSNWNGTPTPATAGAAFNAPALGLAPNATGATGQTANNDPRAYLNWGTAPRTVDIINSDLDQERELTTNYTLGKSKTTSKAIVDQWSLLDRNLVVTAGMRRDRIDTYFPGNPALAPDAIGRTGTRDRINGGAVNWDAPFAYPDSPSASFESPWLKTYGAVLHAPESITKRLPWGLRPSIFYNRSENFRPEIRRDPVTAANLDPASGKTKEYGFMVSALDGKVSLKVNRFETAFKNASLQDNSVISFMADEVAQGIRFANSVRWIAKVNAGANGGIPGTAGNSAYAFRATRVAGAATGNAGSGGTNPLLNPAENSNDTVAGATVHYYPWEPARPATQASPWTLADWQAEETHANAAAQAFFDSLNNPSGLAFLQAWGINPAVIGPNFDTTGGWSYTAGGNAVTTTTPANARVTGDTLSKGTEIELFLSPTPNWNITANFAKVYSTRMNLAGNIDDWLSTRWELYNVKDPNAAYQPYGPGSGGLLSGDVRWFGGGQGNVSSGQARFGRNGFRYFSEFHSREGVNVPELRPKRFTIVSNYNFTRERLKGVSVGGAFRWESKSVVGFGVTETSPAETATISGQVVELRAAEGALDVNKPYYSPVEEHFDLWVGYKHKIWNDVGWRIQLNVYNVGESAHLVPISVNPDGTTAAARIAAGTTWQLSSTFSF